MKKYTKKQILYHIIRGRMCYLETLIKEKHLSAFATSVAEFDLDELKKERPYCWKTRKKKYWRKNNAIS